MTTTTTKTMTVTTTDGETIELVVPAELPTNDRADELRALWDAHVQELDGHWKGRVQARVDAELANDVAEAMGFMGAHVTKRTELPSGRVHLFSTGYWAHGY